MNLEIINEEPLSFIELKEKLEYLEKREGKLNFRSNKVKEYIETFKQLNEKDFKDVEKKIIELNIPRVKKRHILKILEILPKDMDSLKILTTGENITIKQEDLQKILEILKEY